MNTSFLPALLLVLLSSAAVQAQGEYLVPGQSGFGVSAAVGNAEDATSLGAAVGYSFEGVVDIGLGFTRINPDTDLQDAYGRRLDMYATAITPSLTYHVIKQQADRFPVSVALGVAYEYGAIHSDFMEELGVKINTSSWLLGGAVYFTSNILSALQIQPRASMAHVTVKQTTKGDGGYSRTDTGSGMSYGFDVSFIFQTGGFRKFVVTPGLAVADGEASTSLQATFVFPTL